MELPWEVLCFCFYFCLFFEEDAANPEEIRPRQRREPAGPEASAPLDFCVS